MRTVRSQISVVLVSLFMLGCAQLSAGYRDGNEFRAAWRYASTIDLGDIDSDPTTSALVRFKGLADSGAHVVTIRIDSAGGSIRLGLRWIREITDIKKAHNVHVDCVVDGAAYSMAAIILESPVCDSRLATPSSTILFHNGRGGAEGTEEEMEESRRMLAAFNSALATLVAQRMGLSVADYRAHINGKDWVLSASEAFENHILDAVVSSEDIAPPSGG